MAGAFVSKTIDFNSQRDRRFFKVIYFERGLAIGANPPRNRSVFAKVTLHRHCG
jgi:hypothetical protein